MCGISSASLSSLASGAARGSTFLSFWGEGPRAHVAPLGGGGREWLLGIGLFTSHEPQALGCGHIWQWGHAHVLGDRKVLMHQFRDPLPLRPDLTLSRARVREAVSQAMRVSLEFVTYH